MYAPDDQDEEVEEEEEFHDVEEEKHKTSQESVGSSGDRIQSPTRTKPPALSQRTKSEDTPVESNKQTNDNDVVQEVTATKSNDDISINTTSLEPTPDNVEKSTSPTVITNTVVAAETKSEDTQPITSEEQPHVEVAQDAPPTDKLTVTNAVNDSTTNTQDEANEVPDGNNSSQPSEKSTLDWANMMLGDHSDDDNDQSTSEETSSSDKAQSEVEQSMEKPGDDSIINNIIKDTQEKLKIVDESRDSDDPKVERKLEDSEVEPPVKETPEEAPCQAKSDGPIEEPTNQPEVVPEGEKPSDDVEGVATESGDDKVEEVEKRELDLDEDVKNPQYIPKKGVFYEHDDRSHDVEEKKPASSSKKEDDSTETKETNANKKNASQDRQTENRRNNRRQRTEGERWNHDLFRGEKQKPKSKSDIINVYGYDIRQERGSRNQAEGRQPRTNTNGSSSINNNNNNNNTTVDRPQGSQDSQRSRQPKEGRGQRQNQSSGNRSRDRKTRRQNNPRNGQPRSDANSGAENRRDNANNRSTRPDIKDLKENSDGPKQVTPPSSIGPANSRRDQDGSGNRNARNDSRGRRKTSRDRPAGADDRLPPANTVMPPITTWSNEDMMKAEAFGKKSPVRIPPQNTTIGANSINDNAHRDRSTDFWHQNSQQNKTSYPDRPMRNQEDLRQQGYNSRGRYQDRVGEGGRHPNFVHRNHFGDRMNQQQDWNRASNFSPYGKSTDYVVKTQTFENSRLQQANMNRSANNRDLREVINERRLQGQQSYQPKVHHGAEQHLNQRGSVPSHMFQQQQQHQQYAQSHNMIHQHQQQGPQQHMIQQQQIHQGLAPSNHQQPQHSHAHSDRHQSASSQQQPNQIQQRSTSNSQTQLPVQNHRQQVVTSQAQTQQRQNVDMDNVSATTAGQESTRMGPANASDPLSSRPIIKTDAYTGTGMHPHQQSLPQHSQNHRSLTGPLAQQGPTASHMVPSHLGTNAPQYYAPSPNSRDAANAAAVASAYHGYMPGGHAVMDATRYHMASQQLADHGYMTSPGQGSDVPSGPVLHQQGMYADTSAGVAGSAYLTQPPGSTISPTANIPVTGAGGQPLPPVSYIQHSQYPPPPYSNPYSQHNQGPPQSGHGYPPYWTYI